MGENFGKDLTFVQFNINCKAFVVLGRRVWLLFDAFFKNPLNKNGTNFMLTVLKCIKIGAI